MANPISSLLVTIGADTSGLEAGGRRAVASMNDLGSKAAALGKTLATLGAVAAAAGAAMVTGMVKSGLEAIDAQAKLARSLGSTIDGLRGLQLASADAGVSGEQLKSAMQQLNSRLGEAQKGTGEAKKSLDMLGLSARDLAAMDADQRMAALADRINELGLSTSQTADVLRDFGIRGGEMVDMLRQGGDAIRSAREDVDKFGLSMSAVDAAKVEMANDAMEAIGRTFEAIRNKVTVALAPLLKELADRFNNVAKENQGFGSVAQRVTEAVISGMAKIADAIHIVRTAFAGLKVVAAGVSAVFWSVVEGIVNATKAINEGLYGSINAVTSAVNKLAGTEIPPIKADTTALDNIAAVGGTARNALYQAREELTALASQDWPSNKVEEFLNAVRARAQEAAEEVAGVTGGGTDGGGFDPTAQQEKFEEEIKLLQEQYRTRTQIEADAKMAADAIMEDLERQHMENLGQIKAEGLRDMEQFVNNSFKNQAKSAATYMAQMTAGVARESKAMFEINKIAAIAGALLDMREAISGAYKVGAKIGGPPLGAAFAAAAGAAQAAQVAAIKSQTFNGGGGATAAAPSVTGTPATPVTPVGGGASERSVLTVEGIDPGSLFSGRAVRELAERLQEHMRDGGTVQFA